MKQQLYISVCAVALLLLATGCRKPPDIPASSTRQVTTSPTPSLTPVRMSELDQKRLEARSILYRHAVHLAPSRIERLAGRIVQWSHEAGFDPLFVLAVIKVESGFQPRAASYAGAYGLMQMLPYVADAEARLLGFKNAADMHPDGILNPEVNIRLGIHYLGRMRDRFKEDELFLAAYNMGPTLLAARLSHGVYPKGIYSRLIRKSYVQMLSASRQYNLAARTPMPVMMEAQVHAQQPVPARSSVLR